MNIKISENIKRLRKTKKITQEGLAEIFNVTPAAVSKWENNETYPDITLLFPLSHFFGVSIDELMGYDYMLIEEEVKKIKEEIHNAWYINNNWKKAKELVINARLNYPNDYEIMVNYLFFITGGHADNDHNVLIQNEKEIIRIDVACMYDSYINSNNVLCGRDPYKNSKGNCLCRGCRK